MNNQYDNQNNAWMARYNARIIFCKAEISGRIIKEILYREGKELLKDLTI